MIPFVNSLSLSTWGFGCCFSSVWRSVPTVFIAHRGAPFYDPRAVLRVLVLTCALYIYKNRINKVIDCEIILESLNKIYSISCSMCV